MKTRLAHGPVRRADYVWPAGGEWVLACAYRGPLPGARCLQPVQHMGAQRVAYRQGRVFERGGIALHAQALHQRLRALVADGGEGHHLGQVQWAKGKVQYGAGGLSGQALAPPGAGQAPADFHAGRKRQVCAGNVQSHKTDELARLQVLDGPEAPTLARDAPVDLIGQGIALRGAQRGRKVAHHLGIGRQRRKGRPVSRLPGAQPQACGQQDLGLLGKAGSVRWHGARLTSGCRDRLARWRRSWGRTGAGGRRHGRAGTGAAAAGAACARRNRRCTAPRHRTACHGR